MSNGKPGFFAEVLSAGKILLITATMRAGKSNNASFIMEMGVPLGYNFYTNMLFFEYAEIDEAIKEEILKQSKNYYRRVPPEVRTITSCSELILGLLSTRKNVTVLDESLLFAGSKKGVSKDIRWFEGLVTQIGKFDSSIVLIAQAKSKLATLIKEDIPNYEIKVHKLSWSNRYCEIWYNPPQSVEDPEESYKIDEWRNMPPTRYPQDTWAPAGFDYDIDMEAFINRISKMNSLKTRKMAPVIIQDMLNPPEKPKKRTVKQAVIEMIQKKPTISNSDIMRYLNEIKMKCSNTYINSIRKEMGIYLS